MKTWNVVRGFLALSLGGGLALAGDTRDGGLRGELRKMCDPVCELRAQDGAFSLLVEAYRQFQSYQIEADYQMRIHAAETLSQDRGGLLIDSTGKGIQSLRQYVQALARVERDLRFEKLQTQCVNFQSTYTCARRIDEDYIGETVPSTVNQREAAQRLKDYCVVSPGSLSRGDIRMAGCVPATTVLLDAPPVEPDAKRLVESCE